LIELFWPFIVWFTNHIFAEDREICELEQAAFDRQGADGNHEIFPVIRGLRRVLTENSLPLNGRRADPDWNQQGNPVAEPGSDCATAGSSKQAEPRSGSGEA
jgi:hypothetical protein